MAENYGSEETYKRIVTALLENDNKYTLVTNDKQFINSIADDKQTDPAKAARELVILYCKIIDMVRHKKTIEDILEAYSDFPETRANELIRVVRTRRVSGEIMFPGDKAPRGNSGFDVKEAARGMVSEGRKKFREGPCLILLPIFFGLFLAFYYYNLLY